MGLASALNSTVSALRSQGTAISAVAENIANVNTTAYKNRRVSFQSLVNGSGGVNQVGSGVTTVTSQNIGQVGQITTTGVSTNIAINGAGFFVVSDNLTNKPAGYTYSRNGNFSTDSQGYLRNDEGNYLLGQSTDNLGVVTAVNANDLNSLEPVNLSLIQGAASPTSLVSEKLNLPADAPISSTFTSSFEIFDSLGVSSTVNQVWTKTASNAWTMSLSAPVLTSDQVTVAATLSPTSINFTFNGDGSLATPATSPTLTLTNFSTGANNGSIVLSLGTAGNTDGVSQYSSNTSTPTLSISSITGNGVRFGALTGVEIAESGLVTAVFDNGLRQPVYQIPIATFPNPNGLTAVKGSVYDESQDAGNLTLSNPTVGNAGSIVKEALEGSTTDIAAEFNNLIGAQQAYSAAAQIITVIKQLSDTLNSVIR